MTDVVTVVASALVSIALALLAALSAVCLVRAVRQGGEKVWFFAGLLAGVFGVLAHAADIRRITPGLRLPYTEPRQLWAERAHAQTTCGSDWFRVEVGPGEGKSWLFGPRRRCEWHVYPNDWCGGELVPRSRELQRCWDVDVGVGTHVFMTFGGYPPVRHVGDVDDVASFRRGVLVALAMERGGALFEACYEVYDGWNTPVWDARSPCDPDAWLVQWR